MDQPGVDRNQLETFVGRQGEQIDRALTKILAAAERNSTFSEPIVSGSYTLITAREVTSAGGFGSGAGSGSASGATGAASESTGQSASPLSAGGGGGGGGGAHSRPVAVIIVGPDGVKVQPIVDATHVILAVMTFVGTVAMTRMRMRRHRRG